jgi:hypothetical protein
MAKPRKLSALLRAEFEAPAAVRTPLPVPDLPKSRHHKSKLCARRIAVFLATLEEGYTLGSACTAAGIDWSSYYKWRQAYPAFSRAIEAALEAGAEERRYRHWLHHPHRGRRLPWLQPQTWESHPNRDLAHRWNPKIRPL